MSGAWIGMGLVWSVLGLALGYVLGYFTREVRAMVSHAWRGDLRESGPVTQEPVTSIELPPRAPRVDDTVAIPAAVPATASRRASRTDIVRAVVGVAILILMFVSTLRYYQVTDCQAGYLGAVQASLKARSDATGQDTVAQIKLLTAQASGDPDAAKAAALDRIDSLRALDRSRAANPLPGPASCGEPNPTSAAP